VRTRPFALRLCARGTFSTNGIDPACEFRDHTVRPEAREARHSKPVRPEGHSVTHSKGERLSSDLMLPVLYTAAAFRTCEVLPTS